MVRNSRKLSPLLAAGAGVAVGAVLLGKLASKPRIDFQGKIVLITGGSRGLGLALAEEFGKRGAKLVLAARGHEGLQRARDLLRERGIRTDKENMELFAGDLRSDETCRQLVERATQRFGKVDVLINNAGVIYIGPVEKQPLEAYKDSMDTDFFATVQMVNAVMPQMLQRGQGSIVNIASVGGKLPVPHLAPYTAAKFATVGYSGTLHAELKSKGLRVTTVGPGLMRTGSYPNSIVVGDLQKEYRWFSLSASLPGLAHSTKGAARTIVDATSKGRAEITIGADAYLAARFYGLLPETVSALGSLAEQYVLPATTGGTVPTPARRIGAPKYRWWQTLSRRLTQTQNQPTA